MKLVSLNKKIRCVAIGTSAGGIDALKSLLPAFKRPSHLSVVVVIHLPSGGPNLLPELFEDICDFKIKEAESGESMGPETIYICPPDYHLFVEPDLTMSLSNEEPECFSRPSINALFDSVANSLGSRGMGILLTGANEDGAAGLLKMKTAGATTIVQSPEDAISKEMPEAAIKLNACKFIFPLPELVDIIRGSSAKGNTI